MVIVAIAFATHFILGLAICAIVSKLMRSKLEVGALLSTTVITSIISSVSCLLVFVVVPPFSSLPGGLMDGGVMTMALFIAAFTSVYFFSAATVLKLWVANEHGSKVPLAWAYGYLPGVLLICLSWLGLLELYFRGFGLR